MLKATEHHPTHQFSIEVVHAVNLTESKSEPNKVFVNCAATVLKVFQHMMQSSPILGATFYNPYTNKVELFPSEADALTPRDLQLLARNEAVNVDGVMNTGLYKGLLTADQVATIRCLVKSTVVSGMVYATHTGGYRHPRHKFETPTANILLDQAGLQWQGDFRNSGGIFFYPDDTSDDLLPHNYQHWQNDMFKAMYGGDRPAQCSSASLDVKWMGVAGKLDLNGVRHAIAVEFSQALEAAVEQGKVDLLQSDKINFRFCRAGMGFFSSGLTCDVHPLRVARLEGIELALKSILSLPEEQRQAKLGQIGRIVLPHSNEAPYSDAVISRIGNIVETLGLEWGGAPEEDTYKPEIGYINATTNCADPHAMPGNEGGPSSVDACAAFNANVNHHNAAINSNMQFRSSHILPLPSYTPGALSRGAAKLGIFAEDSKCLTGQGMGEEVDAAYMAHVKVGG